jgi:hypothetical protein
MSSNRENVKQERRSKKRERPDYENSKHIEHKLRRVFSKKDRSEKYKRYDTNEEDL